MKRLLFIPLILLLMASFIPLAMAQSSVTTVITAMDSNQEGDGYILRTPKGEYRMPYGTGGYGRFGRIFDLVLESIDNKFPLTLILGPDGIEVEDVIRPDTN